MHLVDHFHFDLPISLGILAGSSQFQSDRFSQYAVVGELALDGCTRPAKGALSMAMAAADKVPLAGYHMPFPAVGFVERRDIGYRWSPVSYQFNL